MSKHDTDWQPGGAQAVPAPADMYGKQAKRAEAEGVVVAAKCVNRKGLRHNAMLSDYGLTLQHGEPLVRQSDHLAALSAVTAERDAEVEALRKDAERYRWLRDQAPRARGEWEIDGQSYGMMLGADQDDVDAAVDSLRAALAAKEA